MSLLPIAASAVEVFATNGTIGAVDVVAVMMGDEGIGGPAATTAGAGEVAVVDGAGGVFLTISTTMVVGEAGAATGAGTGAT